MIDNKHSILEIPGTALYLMDYFGSMGYDVVLHEDWEDLGKILTESQTISTQWILVLQKFIYIQTHQHSHCI